MRRDNRRNNRRESKYDSKAVSIRRVAKVTAGGKRLRFSAMVVVGDRNGTVGVALGRGVDTRSAIEKGIRKAEKNARKIQLIGDTIPHEMLKKKGAAKVLLRPAKPGTGVIAGSSVRTVLELCGIDNVYGKILGSSDLVANTYCTFEALTDLRSKRVLEKMTSMQARVNLKEQLDEERKKREIAMRKKAKKYDDKKGRGGRGGRGQRGNRYRSNRKGGKTDKSNQGKDGKPEAKKDTPAKDVKPEAKKEAPVKDAKPEAKKEAPVKDVKPKAKKEAPVKDAKPKAKKEAPVKDAKPKAKKEDAPKEKAAKSDKETK